MNKNKKSNSLTVILISLGSLAFVAGVYLGVKAISSNKKKTLPKSGGSKAKDNTQTTNNGGQNNATTPSKNVFPLGYGSRDEYPNTEVRQLQSALSGLGASALIIDGIFGKKTEAALVAQTGKNTVGSQSELDALTNSQPYMTPPANQSPWSFAPIGGLI